MAPREVPDSPPPHHLPTLENNVIYLRSRARARSPYDGSRAPAHLSARCTSRRGSCLHSVLYRCHAVRREMERSPFRWRAIAPSASHKSWRTHARGDPSRPYPSRDECGGNALNDQSLNEAIILPPEVLTIVSGVRSRRRFESSVNVAAPRGCERGDCEEDHECEIPAC